MRQEPELAHPFNRRPSTASVTSTSSKVSSKEKAHAKSLRNAGKEAFLTVVRETVEELAVEAAAQALEDEEARTDGMHKRDRSSGSSRSHSHRRSSSRASNRDLAPGQTIRPGVGPSQDSASGSPFRGGSGGGGGGGHSRRSSRDADGDEPSERRRRRSRNTSVGQGEGQSIVAAAMATFGGGIGSANGNGGGDKPRSFKGHGHGNGHHRAPSASSLSADYGHGHHRAPSASSLATDRAVALEEREEEEQEQQAESQSMVDDEKETLLELLSGAYGQVNDLTDELKMSLDKLSDTEKELKMLQRSQSNPQLLPKPSPTSDAQSPKDVDMDDAEKRKPVSKILKGMFPSDEGAKSTPAAVRQLQVEVQRLRQRSAQAHAKEEKHKSDMSHMQRLMAVMESQINKADQEKKMNASNDSNSNGSSSRSAKQPPEGTYCMTPGGTRYQDGVTKPLVARVAELEEKLVQCSMENATAKQEHLTAQLNGQKLEKTLQKLRHELAKSRAMNDLLQNEIDRLQGRDPEGEADGSGWRRWLGGVQEPLSPEPNPIQVSGDSDSPVVVVRDLDNNQLVYAPGRSQFT